MPEGPITNALIRCTREDNDAEDLFELVRADLGLWVLELNYGINDKQSEQLEEIQSHLLTNLNKLRELSEGSDDYTLHLSFSLEDGERVILPPTFLELASKCGVNLEIYTNREEDG